MGLSPRHQCHRCEISNATFTPAIFTIHAAFTEDMSAAVAAGGPAQRIRSVVVAGGGDLHDKSAVQLKVLLRLWPAPQLLDYLPALIRR